MSLDNHFLTCPLMNKPVRGSQNIINEAESTSFTQKIPNNLNAILSFKKPSKLKSVTQLVSENSLESSRSKKHNSEIIHRSKCFISYNLSLDSKDHEEWDQSIKFEQKSSKKIIKKCKYRSC